MDANGYIYSLTDEEREALLEPRREATAELVQIREDVARLDGYLRGRADSDAPKRGKGANRDLAG